METATLAALSARDVVVTTDFTMDRASTTSTVYQRVMARVNGNSSYRVALRMLASGDAEIYLEKEVDGVVSIVGARSLAGFGHTSGEPIHVELSVTGDTRTQLEAKVWRDGHDRPEAPTVTATDATPQLQVAGGVGVQTYIGGAVAELPFIVRFGSLEVRGA